MRYLYIPNTMAKFSLKIIISNIIEDVEPLELSSIFGGMYNGATM